MILFTIIMACLFCAQLLAESSSGCGLGWQVLKKNSLMSSSTRITTNHLFLNQFFGTTSGTSGCSKHSIVKKESKAKHYLQANYENLRLEMAMGGGEVLAGLINSFGCGNHVTGIFVKEMRDEYSSIFQNNSKNAYTKVQNIIDGNHNLSNNCQLI